MWPLPFQVIVRVVSEGSRGLCANSPAFASGHVAKAALGPASGASVSLWMLPYLPGSFFLLVMLREELEEKCVHDQCYT